MADPSPRRIFITVADVSADHHAAHLIHSLKQLDSSLIIEGFGGAEMRAAGAKLYFETVKKAAMGLAALKRGPEVFRLRTFLRKHFQKHRPDLLICSDSWAMNSHFAKLAHGMGIKVLYYIAPQTWASRPGRVKKLRRWVDQLACILPFEEDYFRKQGVNAKFVGHPLFDELPERSPRESVNDFSTRQPVVGLLPGSRRGEAKKNLPPMLKIAEQIRRVYPQATFVLPTTDATDGIVRRLTAGQSQFKVQLNSFDALVARCDFCVTVSGTATLHVAGHLVPMLVVYRLNLVLWNMIARFLVHTRTFALVNLLSEQGRHIVPEFVPWSGDPDPVAQLAIAFLQSPAKRREQVEQLSMIIHRLDKTGASMCVANLAMEMMGQAC